MQKQPFYGLTLRPVTSVKKLEISKYLKALLPMACATIFGCSVLEYASLDDLRSAIDRGDYAHAEELWKKGIKTSDGDPYMQFMQIKDRMQKTKGIKIEGWRIIRITTEKNRFYGALDIKDQSAAYGVGLTWDGEKWTLKPDYPEIPSYVRNNLQ